MISLPHWMKRGLLFQGSVGGREASLFVESPAGSMTGFRHQIEGIPIPPCLGSALSIYLYWDLPFLTLCLSPTRMMRKWTRRLKKAIFLIIAGRSDRRRLTSPYCRILLKECAETDPSRRDNLLPQKKEVGRVERPFFCWLPVLRPFD